MYEKTSGSEITADAVITEFSLQYPDEDKDMVFGTNDDYDDLRKVSAFNYVVCVCFFFFLDDWRSRENVRFKNQWYIFE